VRHNFEAVVRHTSEAVVRHTSEAVVRHFWSYCDTLLRLLWDISEAVVGHFWSCCETYFWSGCETHFWSCCETHFWSCCETHFWSCCETHFWSCCETLLKLVWDTLLKLLWDTSEAVVRHTSEAVVRHTSEAQLSSQIEHSGVAAIDLPDSQQHLLLVCTGVPLLLNEGCLVLPANSDHCAFLSIWFTSVLTRHSLSSFHLVERPLSSVAEMAWLKNKKWWGYLKLLFLFNNKFEVCKVPGTTYQATRIF
jgi:hypothetical protein